MKRRPTIADTLMGEHIHLPGAPELIVTRAWAYAFWQRCGRPVANGGYDSADYLTFSGTTTDAPLTDLTEPWAAGLLARLEKEC
jgi:hypothetical protein